MTGRQLAFDLPFRPALGESDFLVAPCNEAAVAWLDRWPAWPVPTLAIFGPEGCGKSHLVNVWQGRSGAVRRTAVELAGRDPSDVLGRANALALEDADRGVDEIVLFHVFNLVVERRGWLLLTGRQAPARWPVRLPDLKSRLSAMAAVEVLAPDDRLVAGVLAKQFADRQIKVADDVIDYLLPRMERSFAALAALVDDLDRAALAARRPITVPLARDVLGRLTSPPLIE